MRGMNGLFGLVVCITIGETMLAGIATATAAVFFLSPLPASPSIPPRISGQVMTATDNTDLQKLQQRLTIAVHKLKEQHEVHMKPEIIQGQFGPRIGGNNTEDSDDDQGDIELSFGNKDTFVLEDEPIAVEDHISRDSSSVTLSQPGKESTLIQELNSEKSKNQALDLQLQNQIHLIQKFVSLYHSDDSSGSPKEEFNNILQQLTELKETLPKNYSSTWSHHLPNSSKPSSFQDFQCQVDPADSKMSSGSDNNDSVHRFSHIQELEELQLKLNDLQSENQDLSTEMAQTKSNFDDALLATKDELEKRYQAAEESQSSMAETVKNYLENIQALKEENSSLSASISTFEKLLSTHSEQASRGHETEALLSNELALLKSEKDTLNLSLQKKDEDIQVLSEKLALSHQELMNLKNMERTLEQALTGSQDENRQLKDQLNSRVAEMDQLRGDDEKVFAEKLAASQAEVNRLKSEIESLIDESSKHQKTVENEMAKLKEVISDQIVQLEEENSQQSQAVDEQGMSFFETSLSVDLMELEQEWTSDELALQKAEKEMEQLQRDLCLERSHGLAASGTSPWVADKELVQSLYRKYGSRFRTPSVLEKIKDSKHVQSLYRRYKPRFSMQRSGYTASGSSSTTSGISHLTSNSSA